MFCFYFPKGTSVAFVRQLRHVQCVYAACTEIPKVNEERESSDLDCITQHRAFSDNCLNEYVLIVSMYDYRH
jgi:hypothetical protein